MCSVSGQQNLEGEQSEIHTLIEKRKKKQTVGAIQKDIIQPFKSASFKIKTWNPLQAKIAHLQMMFSI